MADGALAEPLLQTLTASVQGKVNELGWGDGGDNTDLAEYIVLMVSSGKDESSFATELATELLSLEANDPTTHQFARWLYQQVAHLQQHQQQQQQSQPPQSQSHQESHSSGADSTTITTNATGRDGLASATGHADASQNPHQSQQPSSMSSPSMTLPVDMETDFGGHSKPDISAPTGPRSMRNGGNARGGRDKRMIGQINRTIDRSHDSVLHRVRGSGTERINTHSRGPPSGVRGSGINTSRMPRSMNGRVASIAHGLAQPAASINVSMNGHPAQGTPQTMNMGTGPWMMPTGGQHAGPAPHDPNQIQMVAMLEQQSRLIQQLHHQQQMMMKNQNNGGQSGRGGFTRGGQRNGNFRGGRAGSHGGQTSGRQSTTSQDHIMRTDSPAGDADEDVDMSQSQTKRENPNPDETVCKYNLRCTNKDCKFAHQSPAAPLGITVDIGDVCSFGVACKNKKCVGRHPSPAAKMAHQSEQDCKFYPNCTNPHCPFRHPPPPCRNGGDCSVPNCKFTHLDTMCKYKPCTNRFCKFKHEEGQRGTFQDKVWVAGSEGSEGKDHVSERKFVHDDAGEEMVLPDDPSHDHDVALETIS